ncbi:hypothetical protein DPEC_G00226500 [Dallia pectoralis]|uniref:Uncharacterized protein n=1 Tax=Dallia pectoralis TaxID=75939 RepID=A0ACC2G102_DALPE|nr:hypothetical protein DPEC_G00226500 [Dallia pectoralis]
MTFGVSDRLNHMGLPPTNTLQSALKQAPVASGWFVALRGRKLVPTRVASSDATAAGTSISLQETSDEATGRGVLETGRGRCFSSPRGALARETEERGVD